MKFFGWVHRHFHHKEKSDNNVDKVALLENEALCDHVLWKEGILAIGTLGTDLFQDNHKPKHCNNVNQVLFFGDDHDEEMECPLMVLNDSKNGFDHVKEQDLPSFDDDDEIAKPKTGQEDCGMKDSTKIKKHGERTTLADLFRADSNSETNFLQNDGLSHDRNIKVPYNDNDIGTESIKSFLILKNKNKLVPIKKTKQLIKRMLKKKIHPDITGVQKTEIASTTTRETDVHTT